MRPLSCLTLSLLLSLTPLPLLAADHAGHAHGSTAPAQGQAQPLTDGVVKKVDKAAGKVTLTHGPLPNGMPAMTMAFAVKDVAWLTPLQPGQKVRFALNDGMTIIHLEMAQ